MLVRSGPNARDWSLVNCDFANQGAVYHNLPEGMPVPGAEGRARDASAEEPSESAVRSG